MNKDDLLTELANQISSGAIDASEVRQLLGDDVESDQPIHATPAQPGVSANLVTRLLFIIGAVFITLGVIYLVSQIWNDLSTVMRIAITLGLGIVFAGTGSWFLGKDPEADLGSVFHAIGGFMVPGGALITLNEMDVDTSSSWPVTLTIAMVFAFYLLLAWHHRRVVLSFFCLANGTALAYLLTDSLLPNIDGMVYDYLTMCIGGSYIIFAQLFRTDWNARLAPLLLFFGPIGFYGAAFSQIFEGVFMEMLFPILAFGGMALAVAVLRSRLALSISTFATIAYIIYFTAEYFADSIGWPVALILLGFTIIGIGYFSIRLNRKYLRPIAE